MIEDRVRKIGQTIRNARKEQGLTQEQLAAASSVGLRFLRELENGKASCHLGKTLQVLAMLGTEVTLGGEAM